MKTIIAGSRTCIQVHVDTAMANCPFTSEIKEVVSGGAMGADKCGELWAFRNKLEIKQFIPNWKEHGKAGGPIRNREMAAYADALVAVWDGESKGTRNMIEEAEKLKLRVYVYQLPRKKKGPIIQM